MMFFPVSIGFSLLEESLTLTNLGNNHEFIIKEYRLFREAQNKVTRTYAQSGQYHTVVESHVHLTFSTL